MVESSPYFEYVPQQRVPLLFKFSCVAFNFSPVCLCCLHQNLLSAYVPCGRTQSIIQMKEITRKIVICNIMKKTTDVWYYAIHLLCRTSYDTVVLCIMSGQTHQCFSFCVLNPRPAWRCSHGGTSSCACQAYIRWLRHTPVPPWPARQTHTHTRHSGLLWCYIVYRHQNTITISWLNMVQSSIPLL